MLAFERHNHGRCVKNSAAAAEKACEDKGLRLTPIRRRVLEILLEEHRALGAYDVLERLSAEGQGGHPPVAYRALDFLVAHGFVHRLERLNAFVACACPAPDASGEPPASHRPAFLICRSCQAVAEADAEAVARALDGAAAAAGFRIEAAAIEAEGLCPGCQERA